MRVQAFSDDDEAASPALQASRWLIFETELDGHAFCMHDGSWYAVDEGLDLQLSRRVSTIFDLPSLIATPPPWPSEMEEQKYNHEVASALGGISLDRKLIQCDSNPKGFEACDVFTPEGVLIHVKKIGRSTGASHLFAQAGVSAITLREDSSARSKFIERVVEFGGDASWVPERFTKVALVMGNRNLIGHDSLFSFSRIRLVRLFDELTRQGVDLSVASVAYSPLTTES
jgi:uncharacterized protein (TIGR04141 family)